MDVEPSSDMDISSNILSPYMNGPALVRRVTSVTSFVAGNTTPPFNCTVTTLVGSAKNKIIGTSIVPLVTVRLYSYTLLMNAGGCKPKYMCELCVPPIPTV